MEITIRKTVIKMLEGEFKGQFVDKQRKNFTKDLQDAYLFEDNQDAIEWSELINSPLFFDGRAANLKCTTWPVKMIIPCGEDK